MIVLDLVGQPKHENHKNYLPKNINESTVVLIFMFKLFTLIAKQVLRTYTYPSQWLLTVCYLISTCEHSLDWEKHEVWLLDQKWVTLPLDQTYCLCACSNLPSSIKSSVLFTLSGTVNICFRFSLAVANYKSIITKVVIIF